MANEIEGTNTPVTPAAPQTPSPAADTTQPAAPVTPTMSTQPAVPVTPTWPAEPAVPVTPTWPAGPAGQGAWGAGWGGPNWQWASSPAPAIAPPQRRGRRGNVLKVVAVGTAVIAGVGIGHAIWQPSNGVASDSFHNSSGASGASGSSGTSGSTGSTGTSNLPPSSGSGSGSSASSVASAVDPGLVDINVTLGYQNEAAAGTGMVLTSSGEVLTNNHVIDGATSIKVTDIGNGRTYSATVVGYDRTDDVAVLQLTGASGLHTVSIGNSSTVRVGDAVLGIGNAGGTGGTPSVAEGSVTALNQTITASDEGSGTSEQLSGLIETDAPIQPGDSGGPLVNSAGQVIGMDTAGSDSSSGQATTQAFAIPINRAIALAEQMEAGQGSSTVHIGTTAMLGVEVQSTSQTSLGGGFGSGSQGSGVAGVTIANVVSGSPADDAGMTAGDTITSVGSTSVTSPDGLSAALSGYHPGNRVQIQWVDQSGQQQSATVTLASGPPQ